MRALSLNQASLVSGGILKENDGRFPLPPPGLFESGGDNVQSLGTVTVTGSLADLQGLGIGDGAAIGGALGGAAAIGGYLAGHLGSMALGDAIALGTLAGGTIGIAAVLIGAAGVWAFYQYAM
jgi:hypothetical protein